MRNAETPGMERAFAALLGLAALVAVALTGGGAAAQPSSPPSATTAPPGPTPPNAPTPPEQIAPPASAGSGVIRPLPGVDPGIRTVPPVTTQDPMPVIPPPGTQGGNPSVQPK